MKKCIICDNKNLTEFEICEECQNKVLTQFNKMAFHHYSEHDLIVHYYNTFSKAKRNTETEEINDLKTKLLALSLLQGERYYNPTLFNKEVRNHLRQLNNLKSEPPKGIYIDFTLIKHPYPVDIRRYITEDGHIVKSQEEQIIDNILYNAHIPHAYEKKVDEITEETVMCDWYIPVIGDTGIYIELWSDNFSEKYQTRKQNKEELYEKYKLPFIPLESIKKPDNQVLQTQIIEKLTQMKIEVLQKEIKKLEETKQTERLIQAKMLINQIIDY